MTMLLFLDFDGVLRPNDAPFGEFFPSCQERLESLLREFEQVSVVISSDWRIFRPVETLRELFSEDIQPRVVGATPWLGDFDDGCRYREILAYLEEQYDGSEEPRWLALDDTTGLFPESVLKDRVVIIDPDRALDESQTEQVRSAIRRLLA